MLYKDSFHRVTEREDCLGAFNRFKPSICHFTSNSEKYIPSLGWHIINRLFFTKLELRIFFSGNVVIILQSLIPNYVLIPNAITWPSVRLHLKLSRIPDSPVFASIGQVFRFFQHFFVAKAQFLELQNMKWYLLLFNRRPQFDFLHFWPASTLYHVFPIVVCINVVMCFLYLFCISTVCFFLIVVFIFLVICLLYCGLHLYCIHSSVL